MNSALAFDIAVLASLSPFGQTGLGAIQAGSLRLSLIEHQCGCMLVQMTSFLSAFHLVLH